MPGLRRTLLCTVLSFAWFATASGCAADGERGLTDRLAFWRPDPGPPVRTRADELKDMQKLSKQMRASDEPKQRDTTLELAARIRSEADPVVRAQILRTLSYCKTPEAQLVVTAGLQDKEANVRVAACEALGRRGGGESAKSLAGALANDDDMDVRLAAARSLGEIKDPAVQPALALALEDNNPALQHRAVRSLEKCTGKDYGDDVEAWRTYCKGGVPQPRTESLAARMRRLF